jgi:hypothetical protein
MFASRAFFFCLVIVPIVLLVFLVRLRSCREARSAPLPVPGILRLAIELAFFSFATWALFNMGAAMLSALLGVVVALHYVASYDRIQWLLAR